MTKYCPNPECPHAKSTGLLPEYEDHVAECANCKTALVDGPAPALDRDLTPFERIAEYSSAHEAHLARAALASHGIEAMVDQEHTPYVSTLPWVQLRVARTDAEIARRVLEGGPIVEAEGPDETGAASPPSGSAAASDDEMRPMRLSRRILLARWVLYAQAVSCFLAAPVALAFAPIGLAVLLLAIGSLGLALWSHKHPRSAFAIALGLEAILVIMTVASSGLIGATGLVGFLAIYFAWVAAGEHPPEQLQARPRPTRSVEADIGDAWKEAAPPETVPARSSFWKFAIGIGLAIILLLVVGTMLQRSPLVRKILHGSRSLELVADPGAAVRQELELGLARLAHGLRLEEIDFDLLGISERDTEPAIQLSGTPPAKSESVDDLLRQLFPEWKILHDTHEDWWVQPGAEVRAEIIDDALDETLAGIREEFAITIHRIDRPVGGEIKILADLPGDRTLSEIRDLLDSPARLELRPVRYPSHVDDPSRWSPPPSRDAVMAMFDGSLPAGTELIPDSVAPGITVYWPVARIPVIVGRDLRDASPTTDEFGSPAINFLLTEEAGRRLEAATSQMIGMKMALVLRESAGAGVVAVPVIQGAIGTQGIIQGGFTATEARSVANRMRAGSRAIPIRVVVSRDEPEP